MSNMMAYFQYEINQCTGKETPQYREDLLNEIEHYCAVLRAKKIKVPERLGNWIDFLNGN
tara:strand:- start:19 stop:198 length:180 start_codon:yes stop_codon:yes gene_type:complete